MRALLTSCGITLTGHDSIIGLSVDTAGSYSTSCAFILKVARLDAAMFARIGHAGIVDLSFEGQPAGELLTSH